MTSLRQQLMDAVQLHCKRMLLYAWRGNTVVQSATLGFGKDSEYREIEKAEGVAIDPDTNRLYVVSDEKTRLYVFDIRE